MKQKLRDSGKKDGHFRRCAVTGVMLERSSYICFVRRDSFWYADITEKLTKEVKNNKFIDDNTTLCLVNADKNTIREAVAKNILFFSVPVDEMISNICQQIEKRILGFISLANKAGKLVSGADKVKMSIKSGNARLLIQAEDGSVAEVKKIANMAKNNSVIVAKFANRRSLGRSIGKNQVVHVALIESEFVNEIQQEMCRLAGFQGRNAI